MGRTFLRLGPDRDGRTLEIAADRIARVGSDGGDGEAERSLGCEDCLLQPGRINAHTHMYSGLAPFGMPPPERRPENFVEILERVWWRLDRALDERSLRAAARLYVSEALLAGTTTLIDHHESPNFIEGSLDVLADACQELGVRAVLCFGATERNGGREEARLGLEECRRFIHGNRRPRVRGVVGLHASFTVSDDTVRAAGELCRELDTVLHVHLAEDGADVRDARQRGYDGPLQRLLELGALPAGSILAHGVHLGADEVRLAAEHGLWLVQNPRSNRSNRVGYPRFLTESRRVALGTDGYAARMDDEAAVLLEEARAHGESEEEVFCRVAAGHALAAELFGEGFAPLAPGGFADLEARENGAARHVLVAGEPVVEEGRLTRGSLEAIRQEAEAEAERLWQRLREL